MTKNHKVQCPLVADGHPPPSGVAVGHQGEDDDLDFSLCHSLKKRHFFFFFFSV